MLARVKLHPKLLISMGKQPTSKELRSSVTYQTQRPLLFRSGYGLAPCGQLRLMAVFMELSIGTVHHPQRHVAL